jgi:inner membrane protein
LPTIFTLAVVALGIGACTLSRNIGAAVWVAGVACSMLPDADTAAFRFGIGYSDLLGHRGLSHSLFFALVLSVAVTWLLTRHRWRSERMRIGLFLFFATASHGVLDAFTNGGLGIAFFAPFDDQRFFFPVRPIAVSPIGVAFFSSRGMHVLQSELLWVWLPTAVIALSALALRLRKR